MLEKKLGAGKDAKKRRKLNQAIEVEGFGKGFMDFIDGIEGKLKNGQDDYVPQNYEFSDGEGIEEGDMYGIGGADMEDFSGSDQEGFDDMSNDEQPKNTKKNQHKKQ